MCFTAQCRAHYRDYLREFDATLSLEEFARLYAHHGVASPPRTPRAMDAAFLELHSDAGRRIAIHILEARRRQAEAWQAELFRQRRRLSDAERSLQTRVTRKALEDQRIAGSKLPWLRARLADLGRQDLQPRDARIYPQWYAPVMVWADDGPVVMPMRYLCRPAGRPASHDRRYPGCYNARRDNLEGFWKDQFAHTHAVMIVDAFYENVSRHRLEGRELTAGEAEQNVVIEFRADHGQPMYVACLWSRWTGADGAELLSFAAITDAPPPEVAAAGHDRCIVPLRRHNVEAWLRPDGDRRRAHQLLDERERPYYTHRLAA